MEKIFEQGLLYDFYGELLTDHQRRIYEDVVFQDMSLGEIAEEAGISRQGVHDLVRRCDKILCDYEARLHLVERFSKARGTVNEIIRLTEEALQACPESAQVEESILQIRLLGSRLLEEL